MHRVVVAIDCGVPVNLGIIAQQVESSVVFGLAAALHGEITIRRGRVEQRSFGAYRLPGLAETPAVETVIVPSARALGGRRAERAAARAGGSERALPPH